MNRPERRAAILREFFRGKTAPQIAYDVGCSIGAVHNVLHNRGLRARPMPHKFRANHPKLGERFFPMLDEDFDEE